MKKDIFLKMYFQKYIYTKILGVIFWRIEHFLDKDKNQTVFVCKR